MEVDAILKKYAAFLDSGTVDEEFPKQCNKNEALYVIDSSDEESDELSKKSIQTKGHKIEIDEKSRERPACSSQNENTFKKLLQSDENYSVEISDDEPKYEPPTEQKQDNKDQDSLDCKEKTKVRSSNLQRSEKFPVRKRKSPSQKKKEKLEKVKAIEAKITEKNKLKIEAEKQKADKCILQILHKNLKPDQCLKTITVNIDPKIIDQKYGAEILNILNTNEVSYTINQQLLSGVITWTCQVPSQTENEHGQLSLTNEKTEANEVLIIMNWDELIDLVSKETFVSHMTEVNSIYLHKRVLVGIYGMESYFRNQKNKIRKGFRSKVEGKGKKGKMDNKTFEDAPVVTEKDLEDALTEAQIYCSCSHRMTDSPLDLAQMVLQFTKSIAQIPYKLEKEAKDEQFRTYVSGENRDTVAVDNDGNGLQRLWSQQLTMFPMASLETAEAIISKYPTPASLMEAYETCTTPEGEKLLQAIPVRRTAGPLANDRKIGPELSKRIYKFFTSTDGDETL